AHLLPWQRLASLRQEVLLRTRALEPPIRQVRGQRREPQMREDHMRGLGRPLEAIHHWPLSIYQLDPIREELESERFVLVCQDVPGTDFLWLSTLTHSFSLLLATRLNKRVWTLEKRHLELNRPIP